MRNFNRIRGGAFVIKNKKILLFQRPEGYWYFPGGGVENNETLEQCAVREVWEETGIKVKIKMFLYTHELRRKAHRTLELIYLAEPIGGKFRFGVDYEVKKIIDCKHISAISLHKGNPKKLIGFLSVHSSRSAEELQANDAKNEHKRTIDLKYIPINFLHKISFLAPNIAYELKKDIKNNFKSCPRDIGVDRIKMRKLEKRFGKLK